MRKNLSLASLHPLLDGDVDSSVEPDEDHEGDYAGYQLDGWMVEDTWSSPIYIVYSEMASKGCRNILSLVSAEIQISVGTLN